MAWVGLADQSVNAKVPIRKIPRSERKSSMFLLHPVAVDLNHDLLTDFFVCYLHPYVLLLYLILSILLATRWGALLMAQAASRDFAAIAVLRVLSGALYVLAVSILFQHSPSHHLPAKPLRIQPFYSSRQYGILVNSSLPLLVTGTQPMGLALPLVAFLVMESVM